MSKEELIQDIKKQINYLESTARSWGSNHTTHAQYQIAISNLYIALSNLI
jgi:hypothetical protein